VNKVFYTKLLSLSQTSILGTSEADASFISPSLEKAQFARPEPNLGYSFSCSLISPQYSG
jgi:hypothetical protein